MICPKCKAENLEIARFCKSCANNLAEARAQMGVQQPINMCKICGAQLRPGAKFCAKCGCSVKQMTNYAVNEAEVRAKAKAEEAPNVKRVWENMNYSRLCTHCMREVEADTGQPCPFCGKPYHAAVRMQHHMKPFSVLNGRYLVGDVLSEAGCWITYICLDMVLQVKAVIREFFPTDYFTRKSDMTNDVTFREEQNTEYVREWKETLLKEAGKFVRFSNLPGMAGVRDCFSENQTIYIVKGYFEGITLKTYVNSAGGKVCAKPLLELLEPIILSLQKVHEQGLVHADIYPDNFLCLQSGGMVLLKLEEAVVCDNGKRSITPILNRGYSPEEQYRRKGKLGPWTDVYAVAATIYRCLTGVTPPEALERMCADKLTIPDSLGEQLTHRQKKALLKALSVYAKNRYQSMEEFHKDLYNKNEEENSMKKLSFLRRFRKESKKHEVNEVFNPSKIPKYIIGYPSNKPFIPCYRIEGQGDNWTELPSRGSIYYDPVEDLVEYKKIAGTVDKLVDEKMGDLAGRLGTCHFAWSLKKQILLEQYGIEWHSPSDLNHECLFD